MRTVTVTGTYLDPEGDPMGVQLRFTPSSALKSSDENTIVLDAPVSALTDGNGTFHIALYPRQTGLEPNQFLYFVEELIGRQLVKSWYMRLDASTPDVVTLPAIYPALTPPPSDIEIYPTLNDIRAIAGDLDRPIYTQLATVQTAVETNTTMIDSKVDESEVGVSIATLQNGLIPTDQIPTVRFQNTYAATTDAAMIALSAQIGDICIRPDQGRSYVLSGTDPTVLANWKTISSDFSVTSVNSQTGDVVLSPASLGAATYDHGHETLTGYNYVATYLRGTNQSVMELLDVSDGGDAVLVDNQSISFIDATGQMVYKIDPYNPLSWSPFQISVLDSSYTALPNGTAAVTSSARPLSPDTTEVMISITNWTNGFAIDFGDSSAKSGIYSGIFGSWSVLRPNGSVLAAGVATVNISNLIEMTGMVDAITASGLAQATLTVKIRGTYSSPYVSTSSLLPNPNNEYRLQVGTVDQGVLDAEISGNWPVQTLNLTLPDAGEVDIAPNTVTEAMLDPALRSKVNLGIDNILVLTNTAPVPPGTTAGTVVIRYTPTVVVPARISARYGSGDLTTLNIPTTIPGSNYSLAVPGNAAVNDILVAVCVTQSSVVSSTTWTLPSGWTQGWVATQTRKAMMAYIPVTSASVLTTMAGFATFTPPSDVGTGRAGYVMFRIVGGSLTTPYAGDDSGWDIGSTSSVPAAGFTGTRPIGLRFGLVSANYSASVTPLNGTWQSMTPMVTFNAIHPQTTASTQVILGVQDAADAATVAAETFTYSAATSSSVVGAQFGFKNAP